MPSSLIFTGLVVIWLLILVPAVARTQQEVARPSGAALAGRVLTRPRRRAERRLDGHPSEEGDSVDDDGARTVGAHRDEVWVPTARKQRGGQTAVVVPEQSRRGADDEPEPVEEPIPVAEADDDADDVADTAAGTGSDEADESDDRSWERPPPRYRPGRGGFDPEADAESARRRYAVRQRIVLALLITALLTAVVAAAAVRVVWWAHGGVVLVLVAYLVYLRRQVREEAVIRERRAARMAGTRRTAAADDSDLDEWARRGREATRRPTTAEPADDAEEPAGTDRGAAAPELDELDDELDEDGDTDRVRGVGEPLGLLPARRRGTADEEPESALPRLQPAPPPPLPPGTSLVVVDDDELDLHDLGRPASAPHRRAAGE